MSAVESCSFLAWEVGIKKILFDITSSSLWHGPPVGISRVETELGRRARAFLGERLRYCVFDKRRKLFLLLDDEVAFEIFAGKLRVSFERPAWRERWGRFVRRLVSRWAWLYLILQRLRGNSLGSEEVESLRRLVLASEGRRNEIRASKLRPLKCSAQTMIVSCGHDWDHKDLDALLQLKEGAGFVYLAVVYDLIPVLFPHYFPNENAEKFLLYFSQLARLADHVMCISKATEVDWIRYCGDIGARKVRTQTFQLGADERLSNDRTHSAVMPRQLLGKRFALFVSTIEPRKNHRMLYDAWEECVRQGWVDEANHRLVFVGRKGWLVDDLLDEIARNPVTRDTIIVLDRVDDAQLEVIYCEASLVLFPSHYEGYGLSVAEALSHGKPCIASNAGALAEVGGDLVLRLNPRDTLLWACKIAYYLTNQADREAWAQRINKTYVGVTWDRAAGNFFSAAIAAQEQSEV